MRRIVTGACLMLLMGGAACAAGNKAKTQECTRQLMQAEALFYGKVKAKTLKETTAEEITKLLDEADALCTAGHYAKARSTLAKANRMDANTPDKTPDKASGKASGKTPNKARK